MIEESSYCNEVMKKHLNKELVMTKKDKKDFKNSSKCCICDNTYVDGGVKVEITVISLENIKSLRIEIVISTLN